MDDAARLAELEAIIEKGMRDFLAVGNALLEVQSTKLYRLRNETFAEYVRDRFNLSRKRAYDVIDAAKGVSQICDTDLTLPTRESQARELSRVPAEQRADVWEETLSRTDGKPTAKAVREVAEEIDLDASVADFHERNGGPPVVDVLDDADRAQLTLESFQAALRDAKNAARYIRDGFDRSRSTELRSEIQSIRALLDQLEGEIK